MSARWPAPAGMFFLVALVGDLVPAGAQVIQVPSAPAPVCVTDHEPNDRPEDAMPVAGAVCIDGSFGETDQDIFAWTVSAQDARMAWRMSIEGLPEQQTRLQIHRLDAPGSDVEPAEVGSERFALVTPARTTRAQAPLVLVPEGRWIVGLSVSGGAGGYRLRIEPATLPPGLQTESPAGASNADATAAVVGTLAPERPFMGDLRGKEDVLAWSLDAAAARRRWTLGLVGPIGADLALALEAQDGRPLGRVSRLGSGRMSLDDLGLPAGEYRVRISSGTTEPLPYLVELTSEGPRSPTREDEPNDASTRAQPLALGKPVTARLASEGNVDHFALPSGKMVEGKRIEIALASQGGRVRRLCLRGAEDGDLVCREGEAPKLSDVATGTAPLYAVVSGTADRGASYTLLARIAGTLDAAGEREPNDGAATATPFATPSMRGRFVGEEEDLYRLTVTGDPQLWSIDADGAGLMAMEIRDDGAQVTALAQAADGIRASLNGLLLLPGEHVIALRGRDGAYELSAAPSGLPAGDAEREPNDQPNQAIRLSIGERRKGAFASESDMDMYRVVATTEEIADIELTPAPACLARLFVFWPDKPRSEVTTATELVFHARLPMGETLIGLQPAEACSGTYTLGLSRADPARLPADIEPNDNPSIAAPLSRPGIVEGFNNGPLDADFYRLPDETGGTSMTITTSAAAIVDVLTGDDQASVAASEDGAKQVFPLPAGAPSWLRVRSEGRYRLEIDGNGGTAAVRGAERMRLALPQTPVAAFWPRSQQVAGDLVIRNPDADPVTLRLSAVATHYAFRPRIPQEVVALGGGETTHVPVIVDIGSDAWSSSPVRITLAARRDDTDFAVATAELTADPTVDPVGERLDFAVPEALRGGFNVGWTALGATPPPVSGEPTPQERALLHDGLTSTFGLGFEAAALPASVTVAFGGGRSWPIRGFALDPYAPSETTGHSVKDFELHLSADGERFELAWSGQLAQAPTEQYFVLDTPREARAARLVVRSGYGDGAKVRLGEWKLIADSAATPGIALDLADPARGGHVVASWPMMGGTQADLLGILEAGKPGGVVRVEAGQTPRWIVGFHENRAAQLARLEWTDDLNARGKRQFAAIRVLVSTDGPIGPWTPLGVWNLARDERGRATWELPEPVWARFVKFEATRPAAEAEEMMFPTQIGLWERPTDAAYRSILGEWGALSPEAIFEAQAAPGGAAAPEVDGNDTRETAQNLPLDQRVAGQVILDRDEDWYRVLIPPEVAIPGEADTLVLRIDGRPTADVEVAIEDAAGKALPLQEASATPRALELTARIDHHGPYFLRVREPPHSIAVAYDLSGSLMPYLDSIQRGLGAYSAGVVPRREAVNFMPFEQPFMLSDWTDQKYVLDRALAAKPLQSTSSALEPTLIAAMQGLNERRGARAILVISDAATTYGPARAQMWDMIEQVKPRIFAAHIGAFDDPLTEKQIMQDLAMADGGVYSRVRSQAEMDVAFDRVAAWLRRPARYHLEARARKQPPPEPGTIAVSHNVTGDAGGAAVSAGVVEIILDASGSMLQRLDGRRRIEVARAAVNDLVTAGLPAGAALALRVFGDGAPGACSTSLALPPAPAEAALVQAALEAIAPRNLARTPIAAALKEVANDLQGVEGTKTVIVITDGEETCEGDPRAEIDALMAAGIEVRVNIVGFAVGDEMLKARFREWARAGGGRYVDARGAEELSQAVKEAAAVPFTVEDAHGTGIAGGMVDGGPVTVPPGRYRVRAGATVFEEVAVGGGADVQLRLAR